MGTPGSEVAGDPPPTAEPGWLRRSYEHIAKEWPSALLVVSLVAIAHTHLYWFKAFETYTFLGIGQLASVGAVEPNAHRAVVVLIDRHTFESVHHERSPLDRNAIARDLERIYAAQPDVIVVDLDVSPDGWKDRTYPCPRCTCTAHGDDALNKLLIRPHRSLHDVRIKTVLLEPFEVEDPCISFLRTEWKKSIFKRSAQHVTFADGTLPVSYGVHVNTFGGREGLGPVVTKLLHGCDRSFATQIDPRQLLKGLRILPLSHGFENDLRPALDIAAKNNDGKRIVYYGAGFGAGDTFLSAVGEIYGVEAHAAAYVSDHVDQLHFTGFVFDLLIALGLGLGIAFFWRKYFDARLSTDDAERQTAKVWIVLLAVTVVGAVFLLTLASLFALVTWGWWITPLPIAIGMLIDSFVSGSVDQATHKFRSLERHREPRPVRAEDADVPKASVFVVGARYLPRALGGELCKLLSERKTAAASLLSLWTVIWIGITVFALYSILHSSH